MGGKNDGIKWEQKIPYIQKIDISIQCMKKTMLKMKKTAYFHHLLDTLPDGWVRHLLPWYCWCQWWQWSSRTSHSLHCSYHLLKEKNTIIITAMPNLSFYILNWNNAILRSIWQSCVFLTLSTKDKHKVVSSVLTVAALRIAIIQYVKDNEHRIP